MRQAELEPGFLPAYRLFVAARTFFWAAIGPILLVMQLAGEGGPMQAHLVSAGVVENLSPPNTSRMIAVELFLLLLLMLPQAPRLLGRWFVPTTLVIGLVPLLVGYYWWPSENPLQTPFVIFFFVMLVLIAWQYPFRYVLAYVLGLTVYQALISSSGTDMPLTVDAGLLVLQAAMMLLVGYITVTLVSVQREQRIALARAYERQSAANESLQLYASTLEELTISRERNRLARELHDTLAHSLSAVTVQLEAVRSLWEIDPEQALGMLDKADEAARTGLTEARRALQALRASPLRDSGLIHALRDLAEKAAERAGASLEFHVPMQMEGGLSPAVEQGVYRIAQEALENIVRHAGAKRIVLSLEQVHGAVKLTIEDDGEGLDPETLPPGKDRLGIQGMQERATLIGGELSVDSQPSRGTLVSLTIPT
jgi:signal transduction histidine kinase